jgi:hypothetical protein
VTAMPPDVLRMLARGQLKMERGSKIVVGKHDESLKQKVKRKRRAANKQAKTSRRVNR